MLRPRQGEVRTLAECKVQTYKPMKFPVELELQRLPINADLGDAGLFNQFEFAKQLLLISKGSPSNWKIQEVEFGQSSLSEYTALFLATEHVSKEVPTSSEAASSSNKADDFSQFAAGWLMGGGTDDMKSQHPKVDDFPDSDVSETGIFSDGEGEDFDMDEAMVEDFIKKDRKSDLAGAPPKLPKAAAAPATPSEAGSRVGQAKTVATQKELVERSLRAVGRPFGREFCLFLGKRLMSTQYRQCQF